MRKPRKGLERRKSQRLKVNFTVIYQIERPLHVVMLIGGKEMDALMLDLSDFGMAILTRYNIPAYTSLSIRFTLLNPYVAKADRIKSVNMQGEVRSNILLKSGERRLGICFTKISNENRSAVAGFLKKKLK